MRVSVVIVGYNSEPELRQFFPSVYAAINAAEPDAEFIFIDNASRDRSVDFITTHYAGVRVLQEPRNLYFGPAANKAIAIAQHDLILLLNPDLIIPQLALQSVKRLFATDPNVFSVNPRIIDPRDAAQEKLFAFFVKYGLLDIHAPHNFDPAVRRKIPYSTGGAVFLRRDLFLALGGFDALFIPFYWEDTDLGVRASRYGYANYYCPEALFHHYHSTIIRKHHRLEEIKAIYERNRLFLMWKHLDFFSRLFLAHLVSLPVRIMSSPLFEDKSFFYGFLLFSQQIRSVLRTRKRQQKLKQEMTLEEIILKFQ